MPKSASRLLLALLVVFVSSVSAAEAQETTGTILGTVSDSSGAILPGVTVAAKHAETGQTRSIVTDGSGRYRMPSLLVGHYEVTAQLQGFQTILRSGIEITVGREAVVNFTLSIGDLSEQVTVVGDAPLVETTTSAVSNIVSHQQLQELPLNGRSFEQLALLQPGVTTMPFLAGSITLGNTKEVLVAGSRWYTTLYLLDGTEMNEGRNSGSASGNILGVESVQEFRVLTQNFNAEYGRASGGIVSAITRSGTNKFKGAVYEFFRHDSLDAPNFFDQTGELPPFKRNQYGVAAGGPIVKDRTFFFANFEGMRQHLTRTNVAVVPAKHVHDGFVLDARGQLVPVAISPNTKPFLDIFFPLPNAGELPGTDGGRLVTNPVTSASDNYITGKIDQALSGSHKLFVRYTRDGSAVTDQLQIPIGEEHGTITKNLLTVEDSMIFSSRLLNTFRVGMNRDHSRDRIEDLVQVPDTMRFVQGVHLGNLRVPGFTTVGEDGSLPRYVLNLLVDVSDDVSYAAPNHAVKFGATLKRYRSDTMFARRNNGRYDFTSLANFLAGRASRLEAPIPGTDTERRWRQYLFGFYGQDDWRIGSRVLLNLGLRYEPYTMPLELDGKMSNLLDPLAAEPTLTEFFHDNPSTNNWQPRLGFAWDVFGSGSTSVRGAWGIFQNPILPSAYALDGTRTPVFYRSATLSNPPFPNGYDVFVNSPATLARSGDISRLDPHVRTPTYQKWHVTLDRELNSTMKVQASYSGNRGYFLLRQKEANTAAPTVVNGETYFPPGGRRRNPNYSSILSTHYDVTSNYHGGSVTLVRRLQNGYQFQVAYTLSKHIDLGSGSLGAIVLTQGAGSGLVSSDPDNLWRDRGLSAWDRRHNFVTSATMEVPFGAGRPVPLSGAANALLGGWNVNTIVTLSSGVPLNVVIGRFDNLRNLDSRTPSRPSLASGASTNPVVGGGRDPNHYFDPKAFTLPPAGTYGNLARNTLISPGLATVDLALTKKSRVPIFTDDFTVEARFETFNLLNRANFGQPGREIFAPDGSYLPNAGVISDTTTPSRQIQLGLRVSW